MQLAFLGKRTRFLISAIFDESTINGLQFYERDNWLWTAQFVKLMVNLWKVLNVKASNKGEIANNLFNSTIHQIAKYF